MRAAGSIDQFVENPAGLWVSGRVFIVWCWSELLSGAAVWGSPSETDFDDLFTLVDAYQRDAVGRDVVTDVSRIESVDSTAYAALLEHTRRRLPLYATRIRRHAMVRSDGLLGGLAEGFFPLLGARHTWRIFATANEAFAWMDQPDGDEAARHVDQLVDEARGVDPLRRRVRAFMEAHLADATMHDAARALGVSERTLHRMLRAGGTCFRDELGAARIDAARRLLGETDLKIELIAQRVGYSSQAHLTQRFRSIAGETPGEHRTRARAAPQTKV